jgi:hypothetical protein
MIDRDQTPSSLPVEAGGKVLDTVHLPDALKCAGVRRGRRYVSAGEISKTIVGKPEKTARRIYTTIYEIDSPGATDTAEFQAMRGWYQFAPYVHSRTQVVVPAC